MLSPAYPCDCRDEHEARHEAEGDGRYEPDLGGRELDQALAQLLAARRQAEWLLCRYLADIADGRRFREVGYYSDILTARSMA
jgi:hypothetical protein